MRDKKGSRQSGKLKVVEIRERPRVGKPLEGGSAKLTAEGT